VNEAVVIANGGGRVPASYARAPLIVCADGGADRARQAGIPPHVLVGDLDSALPSAVRWAARHGATIVRHERDKEQSDAELAVDVVASRGYARAVLLCALGGRVDHTVANLLLPRYAAGRGVDLRIVSGGVVVQHVRGRTELDARPGDWVSLFAIFGKARGITTYGLRFSLTDATLPMGISLGLSNEVHAVGPSVTVVRGELVAIRVRPPWRRRKR